MATFEHYALVIPDDYLELAFEHEIDGVPDRVINTCGIHITGGVWSAANLDSVADAWNVNVVDPMMSQNTHFIRVTARNADGIVLEVDRADDGGEVGPFVSVNNAVVVEKRTGVAGRRHRGRMFLTVLPEAQVNEAGVIDSTFRAGVTANLEAFRTDVEAVTNVEELSLLHSKGWDGGSEPADPGNAPAPDPITSFYAKSIVGVQRRRLR